MMNRVIVYSIARGGHNWMCNVLKSWLGSEYDAVGVESVWPGEFKDIVTNDFHLQSYPQWPVFVLFRDYLNWAASWLKMTKGRENELRDPETVMIWADRWKAIYDEASGVINNIPNKTPIYYDLFVQNAEYRRSLCTGMGGVYNEGILNFVPGTGSSFDGRFDMQGRGREMKVLERWKWFLTEEGSPYQHHLSLRPGVMEYYLDHFDLSEDKKQFCETIMQKV